MATYQPLEPQAPWRQLTVDAKDWQQADPALLGIHSFPTRRSSDLDRKSVV